MLIFIYQSNLVPRACVPLDQQSGNAMALGDSKTTTRNFWFRFDCEHVSEIVDEMNKFSTDNQICRLFGRLSV